MRLSQQEAEFGINMFDSLTPADDPEIQNLTSMGHSSEEAILIIFERRYKNSQMISSGGVAGLSGVGVGPPMQLKQTGGLLFSILLF
jgi:hypothetical protein